MTRRFSSGGRGAALLAARTWSHFGVDFACAFFVVGVFVPNAPGAAGAGVLWYNLLAFALQPLTGALCDRFLSRLGAVGGCLLVACGGLLAAFGWGWPALVVCTLGNALFHPGSGRDVLLLAEGRLREGGVFVSAGAVGVSCGTLLGGFSSSPWLCVVCSLLLGLCAWSCWRTPCPAPAGRTAFHAASRLPFWWVVGLALVSVALRSYVGALVPMPWKTGLLALAAGIASCLGKALGGFLADWSSPRLVGTAALALSLPLLCLGWESLVLSLVGLVCFNMTMPVSLGVLAAKLPESPGLAFGLTAQFLFVGMLPFYGIPLEEGPALVVAGVGIGISALCVALSSRGRAERSGV